jgi:hypothetical protein
MANFKRRRCKRQVRCTICTTHRWRGNGNQRWSGKQVAENRDKQKALRLLAKDQL